MHTRIFTFVGGKQAGYTVPWVGCGPHTHTHTHTYRFCLDDHNYTAYSETQKMCVFGVRERERER